MFIKILWILFVCIILASGQENAGTSIARSLQQCYNTTEYKKFNIPPTSINILIDLIRKAEDSKSTQDARVLSYEILHRFRQDGIKKSLEGADNPFIINFSPASFQRYKNAIILQTLIPGDAKNFPNDTLTPLEQCAFHFIISNTVITKKSENEICPSIGRYTQRFRRDTESTKDVETVPTTNVRSNTNTNPMESDCPMEFGVIDTKSGPVQAGTVLAGIAAALQPEAVAVDSSNKFDSTYAVTLAGDIVEAALFQATSNINIVGKGSWNSTLVPRYYFIDKQNEHKYHITDAEVRAGIDGIILALKMNDIKSRFSNIKLSQILEMYYSNKGVFSKDLRACNRKSMYASLVSLETLKAQTAAYAKLYNERATFRYTPTDEGVKEYSEGAVDEFVRYIESLNDPSCDVIDTEKVDRTATDIIIVLDTDWQFQVIYPALSYFVNEIDLDRFGSNITIINGNDGRVILESTNNRLDFYEKYNLTIHQQHPIGFNFKGSLNKIESIIKTKIDEDKRNGVIGGRSVIALFVPSQGTPADNEKLDITEKLDNFKLYLPDLKILVLGQAAKDSYSSLVSNTASDIYTLPNTNDETAIRGPMRSLAARVRQVPRVVKNSACGSNWEENTDSKTLEQYIEIGTTNYYRLAPQYFQGEGERSIKLRGQGQGQLNVCWARDFSELYNKDGKGKNNCHSINSDEFIINLKELCEDDEPVTSCQSIFISVNANSTTTGVTPRCTDKNCRFPDYIKYTITTDSLLCHGDSMQYVGNMLLISFLLFLTLKLNIFM